MTRNTWMCGLAVCLLSLTGFSTASAIDTVEIQLAGVDISYDSSTGLLSGSGAPGDDLDGMFFFTSISGPTGSFVSPPDDLSIDLEIPGVPSIPASGGVVSSAAGGTLNLFANGPILRLDLASADITYSPTGSFDFVFVGTAATVTGQNLPFDLGIDVEEDVVVSLSTQADSIVLSPTEVLTFTAGGTGELTGTFTTDPQLVFPEPSGLTLVILGIGFASVRRR